MLSYRNVEEYDLEATLSATEDDPEDNLTLGEEDMDISSLEDAETSEWVQTAESLQERNKGWQKNSKQHLMYYLAWVIIEGAMADSGASSSTKPLVYLALSLF
jgi:triphosphoribosyl-dephospho-CoA synthetase